MNQEQRDELRDKTREQIEINEKTHQLIRRVDKGGLLIKLPHNWPALTAEELQRWQDSQSDEPRIVEGRRMTDKIFFRFEVVITPREGETLFEHQHRITEALKKGGVIRRGEAFGVTDCGIKILSEPMTQYHLFGIDDVEGTR